jgi:hypothetical protein
MTWRQLLGKKSHCHCPNRDPVGPERLGESLLFPWNSRSLILHTVVFLSDLLSESESESKGSKGGDASDGRMMTMGMGMMRW